MKNLYVLAILFWIIGISSCHAQTTTKLKYSGETFEVNRSEGIQKIWNANNTLVNQKTDEAYQDFIKTRSQMEYLKGAVSREAKAVFQGTSLDQQQKLMIVLLYFGSDGRVKEVLFSSKGDLSSNVKQLWGLERRLINTIKMDFGKVDFEFFVVSQIVRL